MEEHRQLALRRVYAWLAQNNDKYKMEPYGNEVFQYFNEGWTEDDIDTAAGVALDAKVARTILADNAITKADITVAKIAAAPEVASVMYQGRVWDIPLVISNLYIWIANNSYYSVGPIREVHLLWRECQIDEESLVLFEIQIPVAHE